MADLEAARNAPERQFWEQLGKIHAGMLGVPGAEAHMRPMAPQVDAAANCIWFVTKRGADLVDAVETGAVAQFTFTSDDHDYYACARGPIAQKMDRAKLDEFWNPVIAAWYEGGKDDPGLVMLRMPLTDAAIWASTDNSAAFAWEIAKANVTDSLPDVGVHRELKFGGAA